MKIIPTYSFTPILGWSVSRYDTFKNCKRAYFYSYYSKFDNDVPPQVINSLKSLTSIPLEKGNITHDLVKDLLLRYKKTSKEIDRVKLFTYLYNMLKSYCNRKIFSEVYYQEIEKIDLEVLFLEIKGAIVNLLNSNRFSWLQEEGMNDTSQWIIEPSGYGETRFNSIKAYCKVDFFLPINDEYYIFDWKTGKYSPEKHRKQMLAYSLWARDNFQIPVEQINPILIFLSEKYSEVGETFSNTELEELYQLIKEETHEMYSFCTKVDENIPLAKEKFPRTKDYIHCSFCNFRKLCGLSNL